jgi:hypothetical protein
LAAVKIARPPPRTGVAESRAAFFAGKITPAGEKSIHRFVLMLFSFCGRILLGLTTTMAATNTIPILWTRLITTDDGVQYSFRPFSQIAAKWGDVQSKTGGMN